MDDTVAGSHDLVVYLFDTGFRAGGGGGGGGKGKRERGGKGGGGGGGGGGWPDVSKCWERGLGGKGEYTRLARCQGHSAAVSHLDFSLPLTGPTPDLVGRTILRSSSSPGREILTHDAGNGRLVNANLRDAKWAGRGEGEEGGVWGAWGGVYLYVSLFSFDTNIQLRYQHSASIPTFSFDTNNTRRV